MKSFQIDLTSSNIIFPIHLFLKKAYRKEYIWKIFDLDALPYKDADFPLGLWMDKINKSEDGCNISWNNLTSLLKHSYQICEIDVECLIEINKHIKKVFCLTIVDESIIDLTYVYDDMLADMLYFIDKHFDNQI